MLPNVDRSCHTICHLGKHCPTEAYRRGERWEGACALPLSKGSMLFVIFANIICHYPKVILSLSILTCYYYPLLFKETKSLRDFSVFMKNTNCLPTAFYWWQYANFGHHVHDVHHVYDGHVHHVHQNYLPYRGSTVKIAKRREALWHCSHGIYVAFWSIPIIVTSY